MTVGRNIILTLRPETKNDCADEDQQKFIGLDWNGVSLESAVDE
jgi:hypothetical protein